MSTPNVISENAEEGLTSFSVVDERVISGEQKPIVKNKIAKYLKEKHSALEKDINTHLGAITYGYAVRTTARNASKLDEAFMNYQVSGLNFVFTEKDIESLFDVIDELKNKNNRARVFCRSFTDEYLDFARKYHAKLPIQVRSSKLGVPAAYAYLQADFLATTESLSEVEQAVIIHSRARALTKATGGDGSIVTNLYELGKSNSTHA
uniref:CP n=1 Tax=Carnation necrotic fleck virus TaxID=551454 RepID=A0A4V0P8C8_9CLOS|nr:CP [Carnation necrotic fleck virus]